MLCDDVTMWVLVCVLGFDNEEDWIFSILLIVISAVFFVYFFYQAVTVSAAPQHSQHEAPAVI